MAALMPSWPIFRIRPVHWPWGAAILTDLYQLCSNWSKFATFSSQGFSSDHLSAKRIYFPAQKGPLFHFHSMGPFNLSTTCFNTTHNMWNGCTLERCTLPARPRCRELCCANGFQDLQFTWDGNLCQSMK